MLAPLKAQMTRIVQSAPEGAVFHENLGFSFDSSFSPPRPTFQQPSFSIVMKNPFELGIIRRNFNLLRRLLLSQRIEIRSS